MTTDFASLDRVGLLRVLQCLPRAKDVAAVAATCSSIRDLGRTDVLWADRLLSDFDLALEACPGQELQAVYAKLASFRRDYFIRFLGAYADGGCDNLDLTYWVDHVFMPNHWYPFCSESGANINCVGLLKASAHVYDGDAVLHRTYLVERCKYAAALLFGPQDPPMLPSPEKAVKVLSGWSTAGLERLFVDLYQDLAVQGDNSTWGRLLLRGVPPGSEERERALLHGRFQHITEEGSFRSHYKVEALPAAVAARIEEATKAAAATAAAGAAVGTAASTSSGGAGAVPADVSGTGAQAAASRPASSQGQAQRRPRLFDAKALPLFGSEELATSTAFVRELSVSRCGHFTCPVRCGAIFLGQLPQLPPATDDATRTHALASVPLDPFVSALDDVTDLDMLKDRVQAGVLPPTAACVSEEHVEWAEFAPLSREQRRERAARGWHMRPVAWFRFMSTREVQAPAVAEAMNAAEQQIQEQGEPMYDDDYDDFDGDSDDGYDDVSMDGDDDDDGGEYDDDDDWPVQQEAPDLWEGQDVAAAAGAALVAAEAAAAARAAAEADAQTRAAAAIPTVQGAAAIAGEAGRPHAALQAQEGAAGPSSAPLQPQQYGSIWQEQEQQRLQQAAGSSGQHPVPQQTASSSQQQQQQQQQQSDGAGPSGSGTNMPQAPPTNVATPLQRVVSVAGPDAATPEPSTHALLLGPSGGSDSDTDMAGPTEQQQGGQAGTSTSRDGAGSSHLPASHPILPARQTAAARSGSVQRRRRRQPADRAPGVRILPSPGLPTEPRVYPLSLKVLTMRLVAPHSGNVALLKLISPEDLMQEFGDNHEDPNVDCEYAAFKGFAVQLPPGSRLI